ncbi:hypothetical protein ACLUWO_06725 [Pseudoscardovia radai]|uniref:hypothetical protein n=1 Tax=Pseudoscardovia radai TaxID=987066 RepID=UPI003991B6CA
MRNGHVDSYADVGNPDSDYVEGSASIWIDLDPGKAREAMEARYAEECWRLRTVPDDARPVLRFEVIRTPMLTALVLPSQADAAQVADLYRHAARLEGFDGAAGSAGGARDFLVSRGLLAEKEYANEYDWTHREAMPMPEGLSGQTNDGAGDAGKEQPKHWWSRLFHRR